MATHPGAVLERAVGYRHWVPVAGTIRVVEHRSRYARFLQRVATTNKVAVALFP